MDASRPPGTACQAPSRLCSSTTRSMPGALQGTITEGCVVIRGLQGRTVLAPFATYAGELESECIGTSCAARVLRV